MPLFLVERVTPGKIRDHAGNGADRALRSALPFTVEVEDDIVTRGPDYEGACQCRELFRITDEMVSRLKKFGMLRTQLDGGANPCVCFCMGRLVDDPEGPL